MSSDRQRPWLQHYPTAIDWNTTFTPAPLYDLLDKAAADFPEAAASDFLGKRMVWREYKDLADRAAAGLQALGVTKGVKVGLFLPNTPHFIIAYYAILKAGGTVVNYSPLYSERELLHQIEDSETDIMVTLNLEALYPKMKAMLGQSRLKKLVIGGMTEILPFPKNILFPVFKRGDIAKIDFDDQHIRWKDVLDNDGGFKPVSIDPLEDVAVIQYTGGTTGTPKGAMLTHANLYINTCQGVMWDPSLQKGKERVMAVLPFFHVFAMTGVMNLTIAIAGEMLMLPRFELEAAMKLIKQRQPTVLSGVPTMYRAFLNHPLAQDGALKSVRFGVSGGAPLPVELKKAFEETSGCTIVEGYGLTETSPVASVNPVNGVNKPGSIGVPVPATDLIIVDREDPNKEMPLGEVGEIAIVGPQVMKGYWKNSEATAKSIVNQKFLTGDLGYMDAEGYTFIIDREKDLILVSGFNVFPRHIEEALYEHPAVGEAIVIGIPDDYKGEVPKAFVTLKSTEPKVSESELIEFLRSRLGRHEIPKAIEFRDSLPKTMIGKLSKKELIAEEKNKQTKA